MSLRRVAQFFAHNGLVDSPTERHRNRFGNIEIMFRAIARGKNHLSENKFQFDHKNKCKILQNHIGILIGRRPRESGTPATDPENRSIG
jgi:hypothetical protein